MSFAKNLIYIRQHYGVTQEVLAEQLGVSRQTISKWEAEINYPETDKLLMICDLYHTNLDDLMRGNVRVANTRDTELYDSHMNRFSLGIVFGIMMNILGVSAYLLLQGFGVVERVGIAALLSFTVIGVVLLVVSGLTHTEFKRKNPNINPSYPKELLDKFGRRFVVLLPSGIAIILLGVIVYIAISPGESADIVLLGVLSLESLALAILLFMIALGVGVIVYAGMQKSKYDLAEFEDISDANVATDNIDISQLKESTVKAAKRSSIIGAFSGVIMLLATIFFFAVGFTAGSGFPFDGSDVTTSGFMYSWIAFPIGGVFCGIVAIIANAMYKSDSEIIAEVKKENPWLRTEKPSFSADVIGTDKVGLDDEHRQ